MLPKNYVTLEGNAIRQMMKLMEALDDSDDTRNVWTNADFDEKDIEASLT
jgi:transcriptional/translational regulatory protein YebC/TACO1